MATATARTSAPTPTTPAEVKAAPDAAATVAPATMLRNQLDAIAALIAAQALVKSCKDQVVTGLAFLRSVPASAGWNAGTVSGTDVREVSAQVVEGRSLAVKRLPGMIARAAE